MDERAIHELVTRLARPHRGGTLIVEGAAIRAEGSDFDAVEAWILSRGGKPEQEPPRPPARGLHAARFAESEAHRNLSTSRYILPASALDAPPEPPAAPEAGTPDESAAELRDD
jgi:hypothetical protein